MNGIAHGRIFGQPTAPAVGRLADKTGPQQPDVACLAKRDVTARMRKAAIAAAVEFKALTACYLHLRLPVLVAPHTCPLHPLALQYLDPPLHALKANPRPPLASVTRSVPLRTVANTPSP